MWQKIKRLLNDPLIIISYLLETPVARLLSDKCYLKIKYRIIMKRRLNLKDPKTFNEKLQWLKLNNRKPEYTTYVDKYKVREYIANKLGEEYLIPLLGVWDDPEEIDFDSLPNQFVLKCNHNSGLGMCICKDKSKLDIESVKKELKKGLKQNYYFHGREWPYKNVERKIIAEKYIEDKSGELKDYKLMCFNGEVKCSFLCSGRFSENGLHVTFFDNDWNVMPFERHYPSCKEGLPCPSSFKKMKELASVLSKDIPFVRVDFYDVNGKIYFGELTFFPGGGMEEFTPEEWDYKLGEWIV
ncbi:MAG: glycosyl transferase [Clostridia bacterium]|nr:glycosyl transferase [Clostridia bacterium]